MNKFDQLVEDLESGDLSHTLIAIAYRTWVKRRKEIPIEMKGLLCGESEGDSGLIGKHFALLATTIGSMEVAVRRARDEGKT